MKNDETLISTRHSFKNKDACCWNVTEQRYPIDLIHKLIDDIIHDAIHNLTRH